jgi:hypothetical protein
MKRLIYYPPGCYGTFVNWICNTNKIVTADDLPFAEFGNSHLYYSNNPGLMHPKQRDLFLKSQRDFGVQRCCWPINIGIKLLNVESALDFYYQQCHTDLSTIIDRCDRILIIHPTQSSKIWWYQNYCEKVIMSQDIVDRNMSIVNSNFKNSPWMTERDPVLRARYQLDMRPSQPGIQELYSEFSKDSALDFDTWQLRYALAWELHSQGADYYNCWQQIIQEFPQIKFVSLEQLRDNFNSTIHDILDYFEITSEIVGSLDYIQHEWSQRQEHQHKDQVVAGVVECILSQKSADWSHAGLNLFDEIYIEKILRYEHKINLLPTNTWPTNTQQFWKMIK